MLWIDSHCHLDASEFGPINGPERRTVRAYAASKNVAHCIIPAVEKANWQTVRDLAHEGPDFYALGVHPLFVPQADVIDLQALDDALQSHADDARLVAVGEIGLDFFVPALCNSAMRFKQEQFYRTQLLLAKHHQLPAILHVRRSADRLLKYLREVKISGGIAHAFNGSLQQAHAFIDLGFKLGFGGALSYERATQLRRLATSLPLNAIVLETDAPDIPPQWLYRSAAQRAGGQAQGRNAPGELPRIAQVLADLRGISLTELAQATTMNVQETLPRMKKLLQA